MQHGVSGVTNGIKLSARTNFVTGFQFAVPGDESTATQISTGLQGHILNKSGRLIVHDNVCIEFGPDGTQTIKCGSFPSYENPVAMGRKLCKALGAR